MLLPIELSSPILARKVESIAHKGMPRSRPAWDMGGSYGPFMQVPDNNEYELYDLLREKIPCISTAITKTKALVGNISINADEPVQSKINDFLKDIKVNHTQKGARAFQNIHLGSMLLYGKGVGEIVPNNFGDDIYALANLDSESVLFRPIEGQPLELDIYQKQIGKPDGERLDKFWTIVALNDAETNPNGVSICRSCKFVGEILLTTEQALKQSWERFGVPTYHVSWQAPENWDDPTGEKSEPILDSLEENFHGAMVARRKGLIQDFYSAGDVKVNVIGADNQLLEFEVPYRALMEQISGATGLPAWMLGFTWASTERLSTQQADLLTATIDALRNELEANWRYVIQLWMDLTGLRGEFRIEWKSISLMDLVETARAESLDAHAVGTRLQTADRLWQLGIIDQRKAAQYVLREKFDGKITKEMEEPPQVGGPFQSQQDGTGTNAGPPTEPATSGGRQEF